MNKNICVSRAYRAADSISKSSPATSSISAGALTLRAEVSRTNGWREGFDTSGLCLGTREDAWDLCGCLSVLSEVLALSLTPKSLRLVCPAGNGLGSWRTNTRGCSASESVSACPREYLSADTPPRKRWGVLFAGDAGTDATPVGASSRESRRSNRAAS
jgi:hypothetical protein